MAEILEWNHYIDHVAEYLGVDKSELNQATHIYDDLGIDSLGLFSLGLDLIKIYGCKIPLSAVSTIATLGDLYNEAEKSLKGK